MLLHLDKGGNTHRFVTYFDEHVHAHVNEYKNKRICVSLLLFVH